MDSSPAGPDYLERHAVVQKSPALMGPALTGSISTCAATAPSACVICHTSPLSKEGTSDKMQFIQYDTETLWTERPDICMYGCSSVDGHRAVRSLDDCSLNDCSRIEQRSYHTLCLCHVTPLSEVTCAVELRECECLDYIIGYVVILPESSELDSDGYPG
jgi:hypothetical protein